MADEIKTPGAEEEYQPDLMTLEDEDGNEVTFEVIDALDHKGVHYLAVVEYAENEDDVNDDAQLVILSAVSYTHLDVYKRQLPSRTGSPAATSCSIFSAMKFASVSAVSSGRKCASTRPAYVPGAPQTSRWPSP